VWIYNVKSLFDFILPRFCISCKQKLNTTEQFICNICFNSIRRAEEDRISFEFDKKFRSHNYISDFTSAFIFEKEKALQHLIHSLKYEDNFRVGIILGKKIGELLSHKIDLWEADIIIPVPLHRLKKAERGYNQSYFISWGLKKVTSIPIMQNILKRRKFTRTQTELTAEERKENVKDAFSVTRVKPIFGKRIILIDDVITTGATISACAEVLIQAGAEKVFAVSVAIAD
jgi:ComF family protein